jgi:hypothetical protein
MHSCCAKRALFPLERRALARNACFKIQQKSCPTHKKTAAARVQRSASHREFAVNATRLAQHRISFKNFEERVLPSIAPNYESFVAANMGFRTKCEHPLVSLAAGIAACARNLEEKDLI